MDIGREDDELRLAVLNFIVVFIHNFLMQNNLHLSKRLLFLGHRSLTRNKTQTAVINISNLRILIT